MQMKGLTFVHKRHHINFRNQSTDHIVDNKIVINLLWHYMRVKYKHTPHKGVVPL